MLAALKSAGVIISDAGYDLFRDTSRLIMTHLTTYLLGQAVDLKITTLLLRKFA